MAFDALATGRTRVNIEDGAESRPCTLNEWLAVHGPLAAPSALIVVRQICVDASALDAVELGRTVPSLTTAHIVRNANGEWRWRPVPSPALHRRPTDNEVAGRAGAILFECLTATALPDYLPDAGVVVSRLHDRRTDLTPTVVDMVSRLASAPGAARLRLEDVADDLQRAIGLKGRNARPPSARRWAVAGLCVLGAMGTWQMQDPGDDTRIGSHGLTRHETVVHDLATESADSLAVVGEHTMALDRLKELERLWRERVPPDDPRIALNYQRQAWVRAEAEDLITAEQLFLSGTMTLSRALGSGHPYVVAAQRNLSWTLDRRGATDAARELRRTAREASGRLLPGSVASDPAEATVGVPTPAVIAHVAPAAPEREGFRRETPGGWVAPLTGATRWLAGRDGWRLHVGATGACRTAVDTGGDPHRLQVTVRREDAGWRVMVEGTHPRVELGAVPSSDDRVIVTVHVRPTGDVQVLMPGGETARATVDPGSVSNPPYGLTFVGEQDDQGCALVWWELDPHR